MSGLTKFMNKLAWRIKSRSRKNVINKFASGNGLVYFGFVNQHSDEHRVVRGLTVSATLTDNNYCIGSVDGYNVTIVDRSDVLSHPKKPDKLYEWLIMAIDLQTQVRIPHFFIAARGRDIDPYHALFSSFPNMVELDLGIFETHSPEFTSRFAIYARPAKSLELQQTLTAQVTKMLASSLWPLNIEQHDNVLYVYCDNEPATYGILESMQENGLWLAKHLDQQSDNTNKEKS